MYFTGKVAIVTAGAGGIRRATVLKLEEKIKNQGGRKRWN